MHTLLSLKSFWALFVCAAGIANATYTIQDTYDTSNFFDEFNFYTGPDPTQGSVEYLSGSAANDSGIVGYIDDQVYLGVDHTTMSPSKGRASTRVTSNKAYTHGLFIADIAHMPGGICGVWPAFWTFGSDWPRMGEIDIIEGVNAQATDSVTLHTSPSCSMSNTGSPSTNTYSNGDCGVDGGYQGCSQTTTDSNSYGVGFNANGGGVYAMEWTSSAISIYFFPRTSIPSDIVSGSPSPASWGSPLAMFSGSGCDIESHFMNHKIVFDTTFCGSWAGKSEVWSVLPVNLINTMY